MEGKKIDNKLKYSFLDRVKALALLRENDYNQRKTGLALGMNMTTIGNWRRNGGLVIYDLFDKAGGDPEKVDEDDFNRIMEFNTRTEDEEVLSELEFQRLVMQAKAIAVKRLKLKLKNEKSSRILADSLKILNEMGEGVEPVGDSKKLKNADDYATWLIDSYKKQGAKVN